MPRRSPQDQNQLPEHPGPSHPAPGQPGSDADQGGHGSLGSTSSGSSGVGAIRAGSILLLIAVAIGLVGSSLTLGRFDQSSVTRDVVIEGKSNVEVPGRIAFRVAESISESAPERMRIGLVVAPAGSSRPDCELREQEGDDIYLEWLSSANSFASPAKPSLVPVAVARLSPGSYVITCSAREGSDNQAKNFTVTRVVGMGDLTVEFMPLLWFGAALVIAGIFFLAGGITLFVGLVQRGRSKRIPT